MWAMVTKEFRQLKRDRRTLAMMIVLPVLLLVVFGYAARFNVDKISTVVVGPSASQVAAALKAPFEVVGVDAGGDKSTAKSWLQDGRAIVGFVTTPSGLSVVLDGTQLFAVQKAENALAQLSSSPLGAVSAHSAEHPDSLQPESFDVVGDGPRVGRTDPRVHRHANHEPRCGP